MYFCNKLQKEYSGDFKQVKSLNYLGNIKKVGVFSFMAKSWHSCF